MTQIHLYRLLLAVGLLLAYVQESSAQLTTSVVSMDVPVNISSSGTPTITSTIDISSTNECITDVNLTNLDVSHTWVGDLEIELTSPSGTTITIVNNICGFTNNFSINFDDEGVSHASIPCPPTDGGTYQPDGSFLDFVDEDMNGTWTLTIYDQGDGDGGSLNGWGLEITTEACPSSPSGTCDINTPFEAVDITGDPGGIWTSAPISADGLCCGMSNTVPPMNCIEFEVSLHEDAVGFEFGIFSGTIPGSTPTYLVNCSDPTALGDGFCVDGNGPYTVTFCYAGSYNNEYYVQSIPGPVVSSTAAINCSADLSVTNMQASTVVWNDITGGGVYNSLLSCTSGCLNTIVTATSGVPSPLQYEVCGTLNTSLCSNTPPTVCDTVSINLHPEYAILVNPSPAFVCENVGQVVANTTNLLETFTYTWYDGANGTGNIVSTTDTLNPTSSGVYSVVVENINYPLCSQQSQDVNVTVVPCIEICANGYDDDYDGYIDYYDDDCPCDDLFYGPCEPECGYTPPLIPDFEIDYQWTSNVTTNTLAPVVGGEMDGDNASSEIIALGEVTGNLTDGYANSIYIIDGDDGSLKYQPNTYRVSGNIKGVAIGDADRDGRGEFYYVASYWETNSVARRIVCYEYNPTGTNPAGSGTGDFDLQWVGNAVVDCGLNSTYEVVTQDFSVALADFNHDGTPEVYVGNEIYNALTGAKITSGGINSIGSSISDYASHFHYHAYPVAIDVLPDNLCADCSGLELVAGNQVYAVNISAGTMSVVRTADNSLPDGMTSIADYDLDGDLDGIIGMTTSNGSYVYVWDLQTTAQIGGTHTVTEMANPWFRSVSVPVVADFDGDNKPEIGVCGNEVFMVIDDHTVDITGNNGSLWSVATSDNSGMTGAAAFDFNGDGVTEVVYRDEDDLRIIDGPTGANLATYPCGSVTGTEMPMVADIDNDGEAEIICNCGDVTYSSNGNMQAFASGTKPWVPTRNVWNQYSYFVVNVHDDLTIPITQQNHHTAGYPPAGISGRYNNFLKQVGPLYDAGGNIIIPAADIVSGILDVQGSDCGNLDDVSVDIQLWNLGNLILSSDLPISFYDADPTTTNANFIGTTFFPNNNIEVGDSAVATVSMDLSSVSFPLTIYVVANDDGSVDPIFDLIDDLPGTFVGECDYSNNLDSFYLDLCSIVTDNIPPTITLVDSMNATGTTTTTLVPGYHRLKNGKLLQSGDDEVDHNWTTINFEIEFQSVPGVFAQVVTQNENSAVTNRIRNVSTTGFEIRLQEQEANANNHDLETVHWIAIEEGDANTNFPLEVGLTGPLVGKAWYDLNFNNTWNGSRVFLADMQTYNDSDPAYLRHRNLNSNDVDIRAREEKSQDNEMDHSGESVAYFISNDPGDFLDSLGATIGEIGSFDIYLGSNGDYSWETVNLLNSYSNPIVIAGPHSYNDRAPSTIRVRNVGSNDFDIKIDKWDYDPNSNPSDSDDDLDDIVEKVHYMVIDQLPATEVVVTTDAEVVPADLSPIIDCDSILAIPSVVMTDDCGGTVSVVYNEVNNSNGIDCPFTIVRTWTGTDLCGNSSSISQVISVLDATAPVFDIPPADITIACPDDIPPMTDLAWTDNCDGAGTVTGVDDTTRIVTITSSSGVGANTGYETVDGGSYIINMGVEPQTINNGLLPYGLMYELLKDHNVPIKWIIRTGKGKDDIDFSHEGVDYKGSAFIIPAEFRTIAVNAVITAWEVKGVIGTDISTPVSVPVYKTIDYVPHWGLDLSNGGIAESFLEDAEIPNTAYSFTEPTDLDECYSIFVLPHADPEWSSHENLRTWNKPESDGGNGGAVWVGCHSISDIENAINPSDPTEQMNFLMQDPIFPETNAAVPYGDHDDGSPPYNYAYHDHPIMQFIGTIDDAVQNGSEQVYLPTNDWRPTTKLGVWDDTQDDIPTLSDGPAGVLVFGQPYGDDERGIICYTGSHNIGGGDPENIAAVRSFFNFSFYAAGLKAMNMDMTLPTIMYGGDNNLLSVSVTGGTEPVSYQWSSNCGGNFSNPNASSTTFTPFPTSGSYNCIISCIVTDACGTKSTFLSQEVLVQSISYKDCYNDVYRAWTYTDGCGNETTVFQNIIIRDTITPDIAISAPDITVSCENVPSAPWPTISDNCDTDLDTTFNEVLTPGFCPGEYVLTRTWTATDDCGNDTTVVQNIIVVDNTAPVISGVPADITVDCNGIPNTASPSVNDNCDPTILLSYNETTTSGTCASNYIITRTWSATDDCGNTESQSQVITVEDTSDPAISSPPADITVECDAIPAAATLTVSDNCDADISISFSENTTSGSCGDAYIITRTWTAVDNCGNSTSQSQTITVQDNSAPTFSGVPNDITIECDAVPIAAQPTASDNCDNNVAITFNETSTSGSCGDAYIITRTWTAVDNCGNTLIQSQTITVEDNTNPTFTGIPADVTVQCDAVPVPANPTVNDNCDNNVAITFNETSAAGACNDSYTISRTWTATDDCGNIQTQTQTITVEDSTLPVFVGAPSDITVECDGVPAAPTVTATDNCDSSVSVTFSEAQLNGTCPYEYTIERVWTTQDDCGNVATASQIITVQDITPPVFDNPPADVTIECGTLPDGTGVTATDNCSNAITVSFQDTTVFQSNKEIQYSGIINEVIGTSPEYFSLNLSGYDNLTASDIVDLTIDFYTQRGKGRAEFVLIAPSGDAIMLVGEHCSLGSCVDLDLGFENYQPTFNHCGNGDPQWDNTNVIAEGGGNFEPNGNSATEYAWASNYVSCFDQLSGPMNGTWRLAGLKSGSGLFQLNDFSMGIDITSCLEVGQVIRTFTAVDECGNIATYDQVIDFNDTTGPSFDINPTPMPDVQCEDTWPAQETLTVSDCGGEATIQMSTDPYVVDNCGGYTVTYRWIATDNCGNTSEATESFDVLPDNTNPVLSGLPSDITVECSAIPNVAQLTATDNCDTDVTITFNENNSAGICGDAYTITRTWTATDDCGNTDVQSQVITVQDTTDPVFTGVPGNITVECDAIPSTANPTATDNCDNNVTITFNETMTAGACNDAYTITRTWTAEDDCGNTEVQTQIITVEDTTDPVFAGIPADVTVECDAIPTAANPTATDNCDADVTITFNEMTIAGSCDDAYTINRTWTATDDCGNVETQTQTIRVEDTTDPVLAGIPADVTVECDGIPDAATPTATDNCDTDVTISLSESSQAGACAGEFVITRTWRALDNCGNTDVQTQTITIEDSTDPVLAGVPVDITVECEAVPTAATPTATDNCDSDVEISYNEVRTDSGCTDNYTLTRTWTATDDCGNTHVLSQVITVQDTTDPVLAGLPADITVECDAVPSPVDLIATDNCDNSVSITFAEATTAGSCPDVYTITRTWTATDNCGNTEVQTQTITVEDTTDPVLAGVPSDITVECDVVPNAANPTATDNCDNDVIITFNETTASGVCGDTYTITRTWTAEDNCGNTEVQTQTITVEDTTAPVFAGVPADATVECDVIPSAANPTATDNCDADVTITFNETTTAGACNDAYTITRTWTAEDDCGNTEVQTQIITVEDTTDPVFAGIPADVTVECDAIPTAANPTATDNCDADVTITFNEMTIAGSCDDAYTINRTWTATDDCGNVETQTQTIRVEDTTDPVLAGIPADVTVECDGIPDAATPTATDNCDTDVTISLSESSQAGACAGEFVITRTWRALDNCGNTDVQTQTITIEDSTDPVLAGVPVDITIECEAVPTAATPTATDNCDSDVEISYNEVRTDSGCIDNYTLTRTWTATDDCGNTHVLSQVITVQDTTNPVLAGLPADITVECDAVPSPVDLIATDNCDNSVSITFAETTTAGSCPDVYTITRTWTATDNCGNTDVQTQTITVEDTTDPTLAGVPSDITVECDVVPTAANPTATDNCDNDVIITFNETTASGVCGDTYTITRTWTAEDNCGNTEVQTQTITVEDTTAPVFAGVPADATVECDVIPSTANPTATDNCDTDVTITFNETTTAGTCNDAYTITRTWTAEDDCGNTEVQTQIITVEDTTDPVFAGIPADVTVECDAIPTAANPTATDNCDADVTITFNETTIAGSCDDAYTITRTWTATDDCGNVETQTQTIRVEDTTDPVLAGIPADVTVECDGIPDAATPTATDNCDTDVTITFSETSNSGACAAEFVIIRTWTATDNCGNTHVQTQTITIEDSTDPVLSGVPVDITIECEAVPTAATPTATDNCDSDVEISYNEVRTDSGCIDNYTLTRTWTATDDCGNTHVLSQVITVQDTTDPVLAGLPADITVECDAVPSPVDLIATDNCDNSVNITFAEATTAGSCPDVYTITRTWTATDNCGNTDVQTQTITVEDTTDPVLAGVPSDITVECDAVPTAATPTATDNCDNDVTITFNETTASGVCSDTYTVTRTWTAEDNCGNTEVQTQTITVEDTTAPVFAGVPADATVECDVIPSTANPTATDNCDADVTIIFNETTTAGACNDAYTITRTWTAEDDCGNTEVQTQTITVEDTTVPVFAGIPADVTVECDAIPTAASPTATDNCDVDVTIAFNETTIAGSCDDAYTITRTWTATDDCGNVETQTQNITVEDTTDPVLSGVPADVTIECDTIPVAATPTATDNCDVDVEITFNEISNSGSCAAEFVIIRTWTATDNCGNTHVQNQTITLEDTTDPVFTTVPADTLVECDAIPDPESLIATDNCDNDVVITFAENIISGPCADSYTIIRNWSATDDCGNSSIASQTITVEDTTAPILVGVPVDTIVECDAIPSPIDLTATDNCDSNVNITFAETTLAGTCGGIYTITRTWTAEDNCGNTDVQTQTITVEDTTDPVLVGVPADITVECDVVPAAASPMATDNCDSSITITFNETVTTGSCGGTYTITRTWTATDDCANTEVQSQVITVEDNTVPVFVDAPADVTVSCESIPSAVIVTAVDNCDSNISVSFNETQTTGSCAFEYTITRTWTAEDDCGNIDSAVQVIYVEDITAPVFDNPPADVTVECGTLPDGSLISGTDNCGGIVTVNFSDTTIFQSNIVNHSSGDLNDVIGTSPEYFTMNLTGYDDLTASDIIDFTLDFYTQRGKGRAEFVLIAPSGDAIMLVGEHCATGACVDMDLGFENYIPTFNDCGGDPQWDNSNVISEGPGSFAPNGSSASEYAWATNYVSCFDQLTGPMNGAWRLAAMESGSGLFQLNNFNMNIDNTSCLEIGTVVRIFTATDECGNTSTYEQNIHFDDTTGPVFDSTPQPLVNINCEDDFPVQEILTATDCGGAVNVISSIDPYVVDACNGYTVTYRWSVEDACGNITELTESFDVLPDNNLPVLIGVPADVTVECDAVPNLAQPSANDNCDTDVEITFAEVRTDGACEDTYMLERTWTATDDCGNEQIETQVVTVQDITNPVLSGVPSDITISCSDVPGADLVTATDNCDTDVDIIYIEIRTDGPCEDTYTLTRTWTATDNCGNQIIQTQVINVQDNVAPAFANVPADTTVNCGEVPAVDVLTATDDCDTDVTINFSEVRTDGNCIENYTLTRTWIAEDNCGNQTTEVQIITVQDIIDPVLTGVPTDTVVNCGAIPTTPLVTATDNCDANVTITFSESQTPGSCGDQYTITRTWTAEDDCGNQTSLSQTILVQDTIAPIFVSVPADVTVDCDSIPAIPTLSVSDNCSGLVNIDLDEISIPGACVDYYDIIRTWTATDDCGNQQIDSQTITVLNCSPDLQTNAAPDSTICEGEDLTLSVILTAGYSTPYYQWQYSSNGATFNNIIGANAASYTFTADPTDAGYYIVIVSNDSGDINNANCNVVSDTMQVEVLLNSPNTNIDVELCEGEDYNGTTYISSTVLTDNYVNVAGCDSVVITNIIVHPEYNETLMVGLCEGGSYQGQPYTADTTFTNNFTTVFGCDSIVTTQITVTPEINTNLTVDLCYGGDYNGDSYTTDTVLVDSYIATGGCDSIVTTNILVASEIIENISATICEGESYEVGSSSYTVAGGYSDVLTSSNGCDSTVNLVLTVNPVFSENLTAAICQGESYEVGTSTYTASGSYTDILSTIEGCDSIINLELTVNAVYSVDISNAICDGESVTVGSSVYTAAGNYTDTLSTISGCDSIVNLALFVNPVYTIDSTAVLCEGESIVIGTSTYSATGSYIEVLTTSAGCDSTINLDLLINPVSNITLDVDLCDGEDYNGTTYTSSTVLTDTYSDMNGCDSVVTTNISVHPEYDETILVDLCEGGTYDGNSYNSDTTLVENLNSVFGCDSIVTTQISVTPEITNSLTIDLCYGENYNGTTYTADAVLTDTYTSSGGCDSIVTTNIFVTPEIVENLTVTICEGDSYTVGSNTYSTDGNYSDVLTAASGCDSTVNLTLAVNQVLTELITTTICQGESITVGTNTYMIAGNYVDTLISVNGCDSIVTLDLSVNSGYTLSSNQDICEGESVTVGSSIYTTTGNYSDTLSTITGCDSIINLYLTVNPVYTVDTTTTICNGESVAVGSSVYSVSGNYSDILTSSTGCDSTVNLTLIVSPILTDFIIVELCSGENYQGTTYTSNAVLTDVYSSASGCDSTVTTNLIVHPVYNETLLVNLCEGTDYNGINYYTDTTIVENLTTTYGCDSIVTIDIAVVPDISQTEFVNLCYGDVYNGVSYTADIIITTLYTSSSGCDSIITSNIEVADEIVTDFSIDICSGDSVVVGNNTYTSTGNYTDILTASTGCDSTVNLALVVNQPVSNTIDITLCLGEFYDGVSYSSSTTLTDIYISSNGCDSTVITNILVNEVYNDSYTVSVCEGTPHNGTIYIADTTIVENLTTINGCDSTVTTVISISPEILDTVNVDLCYGASYNGVTYTSDATLVDNYTAQGGCDSIVTTNILVNQEIITNLNEAICDGDSLMVGNNQYLVAGNYSDTLSSIAGCDSIVNLALSINPIYAVSLNESVCYGETFTIGNQNIGVAGDHVITLSSITGCDSIINLSLSIDPVYSDTVYNQICDGDSLVTQQNTYTQAGVYSELYTATTGCDSTVVIDLEINQTLTTTIQEQICTGEEYVLDGTVYTETGVYQATFTSSGGCDSLVTVELNVIPIYINTVYANICEGESYNAGGADQTITGTYYDTLINGAGCPTVLITQLLVLDSYENIESVSICYGESHFAGGAYQNTTGTYYDTLSTMNGCDSIVTTNLLVNPAFFDTLNVAICDGESYFVGGVNQTTSGTYTNNYQTTNGCDSVEVINLLVHPTSNQNESLILCEGETILINGEEHGEPGVYIDSLQNTNGCDSLITYNVDVIEEYVTYFDEVICEGDSIYIAGEFHTQPGEYTELFIAESGCDSLVITELTVEPSNSLFADDVEICFGDEIQLLVEGSDNVRWSPSDGLNCVDCVDPVADPHVTTTYTISTEGCLGTTVETTLTVTVHNPPSLTLSQNNDVIVDNNIILNAAVNDPGALITWYQNGEIVCENCTELEVEPSTNMSYLVMVEDEWGCTNSDVIDVNVNDACSFSNFDVPNIISPNGDGYNDIFEIKYEGVKEVSALRIYNRWGELVYETYDISQHWDGTFKGKQLNPGVFIYYFEGLCLDNEPFTKTGNVTILK